MSSSAEDAAIEWRRDRDRREPLRPLPEVLDWREDAASGQPHDEPRDDGAPPPNDGGGTAREAPAPLAIIRPSALLGSPPPREWLVKDWIPFGVPTGLYGDGGQGKSLSAQQLQTACGQEAGTWFGQPVEPVASLGVYCEDSAAELWRRQDDINASYQIERTALKDVHWLARLGEDNLLMTFSRSGVGELTPFHRQILEAALDLKVRFVVVDTASDTFGGNENDRSQVRQYVSRALGSIALKIDGAVLLCAHPSRAGISSGEGDGGSTGWSNALRSRLYLRAPVSEPGEPPDPNSRILERRKANYAARNDILRLRWRAGVIEPERADAPGQTPFGKVDAREVFLSLLRDFENQNRPLSQNKQSGNYAPRAFNSLPRESRHDYRTPDFANAMERLFNSGRIENVPYGRKSDERTKIIISGGADGAGIPF